MPALEISGENPKNRQNNKRRTSGKQAGSKASGFISQRVSGANDCPERAQQMKKPGAVPARASTLSQTALSRISLVTSQALPSRTVASRHFIPARRAHSDISNPIAFNSSLANAVDAQMS
jgi:hypothetical protein